MKLVKIQKEMLEKAVASEAKNGIRKPIHVSNFDASTMLNCPKSYQTYCKKMEQLVDSGFISRHSDGYAYITISGENFINTYIS
tara:strand:+ start:2364 stop:2615 length:252 start_codon:yes stop_codon:yes gene_type:complete